MEYRIIEFNFPRERFDNELSAYRNTQHTSINLYIGNNYSKLLCGQYAIEKLIECIRLGLIVQFKEGFVRYSVCILELV